MPSFVLPAHSAPGTMAAGEYRIHACARSLEATARLAASSSAATQAEARERCHEAVRPLAPVPRQSGPLYAQSLCHLRPNQSQIDLAEAAERCIAQRLSAATVTQALGRVQRAARRVAHEFAIFPDQRDQAQAVADTSGALLARDWSGAVEARDREACRVSAVEAPGSPSSVPTRSCVPVRGPHIQDTHSAAGGGNAGARPALDASRVQRALRLRRRHATEMVAPDRPGAHRQYPMFPPPSAGR